MSCSLDYEYEYAHVISGEDYPTRNGREFEEFFGGKKKIFLDIKSTEKDVRKKWWYKYYWLYTKYRMDYKKPIVRWLNLAFIALQVCMPWMNKRKIGEFTDIYGGLVWGSYPKCVVKYIVDYLKKHPQMLKELEFCKIPEELCFHTIIMNSPYKSNVVQDSKHYGDFTGGNGWGPVYLDIDKIKEIDQSEAFFVRKVKYGSELLEELRKRQATV
ncbi:beta-1,6-N-acetylglucosaminyltransferase [Paenibacillus sp.]